MPQPRQTATLSNGHEVAFLVRQGTGETLIVLHGITDDASTWSPLLADMAPGCTVYALDLLGHGESARHDGLYDAEAYAEDVRRFITEITGGGPVLLAGHSLGGVVAVQVAATAPSLVRSLFLEDPPLYFVGNLDPVYETVFNGLLAIATTLQDGTLGHDQCFEMMAAAPDAWATVSGMSLGNWAAPAR